MLHFSCEPGYYGDPMLPGSSCRRCNCNGNSPNGDTCNPINGQCYDCLGKTEGSFCEQCQEGYYGSAVDNDCKGRVELILARVFSDILK